MKKNMTIGILAQKANVSVETVRFYERKEILKQPPKQGGFRYYPESDITRIQFVKRSQELGFTLNETKELLELKIKSHARCSDVLSKTTIKIKEIEEKIYDLNLMKSSLESLADCCVDTNQPLSECPILDCFIKKE